MRNSTDLRDTLADLLSRAGDAARVDADVAITSEPVPAGPLSGTWNEFEEFLSHGEFELAWETLAVLAEKYQSAAPVWFTLAEAGKLMGLHDRSQYAVEQMARALPTELPTYRFVYKMIYRDPRGRFRTVYSRRYGRASRTADPHVAAVG